MSKFIIKDIAHRIVEHENTIVVRGLPLTSTLLNAHKNGLNLYSWLESLSLSALDKFYMDGEGVPDNEVQDVLYVAVYLMAFKENAQIFSPTQRQINSTIQAIAALREYELLRRKGVIDYTFLDPWNYDRISVTVIKEKLFAIDTDLFNDPEEAKKAGWSDIQIEIIKELIEGL